MATDEGHGEQSHEHPPERQSFRFSPAGIVTLGFLGIAGY